MDFVRGLLSEQRKRLVGTLMQYLEENVYPTLTETQRRELRAKVLSSVGQYHDAALDMLKVSVNDGSESNDEALRLLRLMHAHMKGDPHG